MSDHLPVWVNLKIDYSDEYMQHKLNEAQLAFVVSLKIIVTLLIIKEVFHDFMYMFRVPYMA